MTNVEFWDYKNDKHKLQIKQAEEQPPMAAMENKQSGPRASETLGDKWLVNRVSNLLNHQCMDENKPRGIQIF